MMSREQKLRIALPGVRESTPLTFYGMYDGLGSAGRDGSALIENQSAAPAITPQIDSADGEPFSESMERRYPAVRIHPNRALIVSGEEHRLVLAGSGNSWPELDWLAQEIA